VWEYDRSSDRLDWDERMFEIYQLERDRFAGNYAAWRGLLHAEDRGWVERKLFRLFKGESEFEIQFRIVTPQAETRHVKAAGTILHNEATGAVRVIGVNQDITEQKQLEDALQQAKETAEKANRQKSQFLNIMSHELRTPLTVILGYLPLLQNAEQLPQPQMVADIAKDMSVSGNHLLELINDLLDISKIEAGQMTLQRETIEADALVQEVLKEFHYLAEDKGLQLINNVADFHFSVDPKRFRQILINLVGNALKFTRSGKITVDGRLCDTGACFSISDTGIGISADELSHVFETFRQVDSSSTRDTGGSGLGLAITKRLVMLHGGVIDVESEEARGTVFRFTIGQVED
jgi:PAS domain S-box-containing protein